MALTEGMLQARARRAYELGRVRSALRVAPFVLLAAGTAVACGRPLALCCALCAAVISLAAALGVRGGGAGRAVLPGLAGGSAALALPLLVHTVGFACMGPSCMTLGIPACVGGGAIAGAIIGAKARHEPLSFLFPAVALAGLMGALGCTMAGAAGVVGMLAGAVAAGTPLLVAARR